MTKKQYFLNRIEEIPEEKIVPFKWDKDFRGCCCILTHLGCKIIRDRVHGLAADGDVQIINLQWSNEGIDLVNLFKDNFGPRIITSQGDSGYVTTVNDYIMGPHLHPFLGNTPKQRLMYALNQLP